MSFLKTFSKRADEPFRPDLIEEEEPVEVEAAAPVEAAPADKAADVTVTPVAPVTTPSAPVQVDKIEVPEGAFSTVGLAENLEVR